MESQGDKPVYLSRAQKVYSVEAVVANGNSRRMGRGWVAKG